MQQALLASEVQVEGKGKMPSREHITGLAEREEGGRRSLWKPENLECLGKGEKAAWFSVWLIFVVDVGTQGTVHTATTCPEANLVLKASNQGTHGVRRHTKGDLLRQTNARHLACR